MKDVTYEELRELFNENKISRHAEDMEEYDKICALTDNTAVYRMFLEKYRTFQVAPDSLPHMYFEVEQFLHENSRNKSEYLSFGKTLYQKLILFRMTAPDTALINRLIYRTLNSMLSALLNLNHSNESLQLYRKILYFVKKHFKDEPHLILCEMRTYEAFLSHEFGIQKEAILVVKFMGRRKISR